MSKGSDFDREAREFVDKEWDNAGIEEEDEDREEKVEAFWKHCDELVKTDMFARCLLWEKGMFSDVLKEIQKGGNSISRVEGLAEAAAYLDLFDGEWMSEEELHNSTIRLSI